jgi:tetratricopeptide (TPR) repeat protein
MNRTGIIALLLGIGALLTFSPVVHHDFVQWDDNLNITGNPHIKELNAESLRWMFTDTTLMRRYVPLAWLNWAVVYQFFGMSPRAFHGVALLLHVSNVFLVFLLLRRVLATIGSENNTGREVGIDIAAALGALLWAVHPLRVEAVAWANCVMYPQSLLFALLSLLCYLRAIERSGGKPLMQVPLFWGAAGLFACSLLTYPTAFAFVAVLLIVDFFLLRREVFGTVSTEESVSTTTLVRLFVEKSPFIVITLVVAFVTLWARANMEGVWAGTSWIENLSWFDRIAQAFYVWAYYVWKPLWPVNLSPVYTQLVSFKGTSLPFLLSIAGILGITVVLVFARKRWPMFFAVWLCHLALLVPMLGMTEHPHYPNDRYSYLSAIAWSALIAVAVLKLWDLRSRFYMASAGLLAICALFAVCSYRQTLIWSNSETLFKGAIARLGNDPYRCDLLWRLGHFYAQEKKPGEALQSFREAFPLSRGSPRIGNDLCAMLVQAGKADEAITQYEQILLAYPTNAATHKNLAAVLADQGNMERAVTHFEASIKSDASDVDARMKYASLLMRMGRAADASEQIQTALKLKPDSAEVNLFAGNVSMAEQQRDKALFHFRNAVTLKPDSVEAHQNLGTVLAMGGNIPEALPHFMEVAKLKPDLAEGHLACGMALAQLGRIDEAKNSYQNALKVAAAAGRSDLVTQIQAQMPP